MAEAIYLLRHGETEWSRSGKHTSTTDLPLTAKGEAAADAIRDRFNALDIDHLFSSPRLRAKETAKRVSGRDGIELLEDLVEWDYGKYEGRTTKEIRENDDHDWDLWSEGAPGGESVVDVVERVTRLLTHVDSYEGSVALFAHGHILRAVGGVWIGGIDLGRHLMLDTGSICKLTHERDGRAIDSWNVVL